MPPLRPRCDPAVFPLCAPCVLRCVSLLCPPVCSRCAPLYAPCVLPCCSLCAPLCAPFLPSLCTPVRHHCAPPCVPHACRLCALAMPPLVPPVYPPPCVAPCVFPSAALVCHPACPFWPPAVPASLVLRLRSFFAFRGRFASVWINYLAHLWNLKLGALYLSLNTFRISCFQLF